MKLPNSERAYVELRKLSDYCLSLAHPVGRHKACVFRSALGFTSADAQVLRRLLPEAAQSHAAVVGGSDEFGLRYNLDFTLTTAIGSAVVRSTWIVLAGEDFPRLTTCFVLPRRGL